MNLKAREQATGRARAGGARTVPTGRTGRIGTRRRVDRRRPGGLRCASSTISLVESVHRSDLRGGLRRADAGDASLCVAAYLMKDEERGRVVPAIELAKKCC